MKYRLNESIARYYMLASVYQNNLRQLEVDIQKNRRFKNTIEYSIAIFYIAYMKQDIELLEVTYNKFLKYYNKYYGQSKYWDTLIMLIQVDRYIYMKNYEQAIVLLNSRENSKFEILNVKKAYQKGFCLDKLGKKDEARKEFEFVSLYGNTTYYKQQADMYLSKASDTFRK